MVTSFMIFQSVYKLVEDINFDNGEPWL